jgi:transcriptional regulator with XRE-family HTH domain
MELLDRKKLARLMIVQGISQRELARVAGWKTHSYLSRLLRGEAKTLSPEPALRIAHELGVGVEDLFLTKVATSSGRTDHPTRAQAKTKKVAA